jgi:hypothetical protein
MTTLGGHEHADADVHLRALALRGPQGDGSVTPDHGEPQQRQAVWHTMPTPYYRWLMFRMQCFALRAAAQAARAIGIGKNERAGVVLCNLLDLCQRPRVALQQIWLHPAAATVAAPFAS